MTVEDLKVSRTLLAPGEEQGVAWAQSAWALVAELGAAARPQLEDLLGAKVVLFHAAVPSFRREEFFNTGGVRVEIGHPALPVPLGTCQDGARTAWPCEEDAHFSLDGKVFCEKHFNRYSPPLPPLSPVAVTEAEVAYSRVYRPRKGRNAR